MEDRSEWGALLDRAVEQTPPDAPRWDGEQGLARGRRALRRRRVGVGLAGAAAALVVGGLSWAALPAQTPVAESDFATDTTPSAPMTTRPPLTAGITFDPDTGDPQLARGWKITGEIPGVLPVDCAMAGESFVPTGSTAIQATDGSSVEWAIHWWTGAGKQSGHIATAADVDPLDRVAFVDWLDARIADLCPGTDVQVPPLPDLPASAGSGAPLPADPALPANPASDTPQLGSVHLRHPVEFGPDGTLVARHAAVTILEQTTGIDLPHFPDATDAGVAEIRTKAGAVAFVLAVRRPGAEDVTLLSTGEPGATLEEMVAELQDRVQDSAALPGLASEPPR